MATPGPRGRQCVHAADRGHLQLATARRQAALSPALRFAVEHDARIEQACGVIMERERLDEVAAVELLRLQAQIEGQPIRGVAERLLSRPRR
jgi:AmiR/NasT family two-component response regulator